MSTGKIVLWTFLAILIAGGVLFFFYLPHTVSMGGLDMHIGVGELYEINDIKELDPGSARKIEIVVSSTDTDVKIVDSQRLTASLTGSVRTTDPSYLPYIEATAAGNTLRIEIKRKSSRIVGFYSSNVKLVVEIPESFSEDLVLEGTSGKLTASELRLNACSFTTTSGDITLGSVDVNAAFAAGANSGDIKVEKLQAASARFTATSGDTYLGDIAVRDDFSAGSNSGKIVIDRLSAASASLKSTAGDKKIAVMNVSGEVIMKGNSGSTSLDSISAGKLAIQSTAGDVSANTVRSGHTTINTSSGRISVKAFEGDAELSSTSGDITLECDKPASAIQMECSSGNINLRLPDSTQFSLNAQTNSGSIKTDFTLDQTIADKKHLQGSTGNGELNVSLKTTSGNIRITKN